MKVLLTNDDGIQAPGLNAMRRALLEVPGIELVESVVMLSTVKRVGWMLNPDSRASGAVVVPAQGFDEAD